MKLPLHLLGLRPAPSNRDHESLQVVVRHEHNAASRPLFRAPALPTPHQLNRELPFTVNSRPRLQDLG